MQNIPFQYDLSPALPEIPNVFVASDYRQFRKVLIKIDYILRNCGLEERLVQQLLNSWSSPDDEPPQNYNEKQLAFRIKIAHYALRCNIARHLTGESFRAFSIRLADSKLLQWFTGIDGFAHRKAASKSALQRYQNYFDTPMLEKEIKGWLANLADLPAANMIGLEEPISMAAVFMDSSCVKANIHFPTDWVLLRDSARSLLSAIKTIRNQGLKHRMIDPAKLMRQMNRLCIKMTHTRRRKGSKKQRKLILRMMKKLSNCIEKHGVRYRTMLVDRRLETEWTQAEAQQVINRIDNILNQLPAAIKQAHDRIIGERQIPTSDKILSLYEPDAKVIIRGKAGNEVEFGQGLLLCEQADGIIIDWKLFKQQPPSDSRLLQETVLRLEKDYGNIDSVCTDRGFDSQQNEEFLKSHDIYDGMCPRNPHQLRTRLQDHRFVKLQSRRGQTEARIGIFKNNFLGRPLRSKGFINKELSVSLCVLAHNLWIIARMALADEQAALKKAA